MKYREKIKNFSIAILSQNKETLSAGIFLFYLCYFKISQTCNIDKIVLYLIDAKIHAQNLNYYYDFAQNLLNTYKSITKNRAVNNH